MKLLRSHKLLSLWKLKLALSICQVVLWHEILKYGFHRVIVYIILKDDNHLSVSVLTIICSLGVIANGLIRIHDLIVERKKNEFIGRLEDE